jgi:hypothetical protein
VLALAAAIGLSRELDPITAPPGATNAVAVSASGDILLAGATLALLDGESHAARWTRELDEPVTCAAALGDGRFLSATRRHVQVHAADGTVQDAWAPLAEQAWVTSLAVGSNVVFVCDAGQRAVWRYDLDGRLQDRLPPVTESASTNRFTIPSPYFDTVFADGSFWVVNSGAHEIRRYAPQGTLFGRWGGPSMSDPAGFVGCCNPIHLAAVPGGGFATAEKGIPRIKRYAADGTLQAVVADEGAFARGRIVQDLAVDTQGRVLVLDGAHLRIFSVP